MSIQQKKTFFRVQIRKKRISDKIAVLRSTQLQQNLKATQQFSSNDKIEKLIIESLSSKQKLLQNITKIKQASHHISNENAQLFFPLVQHLCFIIGKIDEMKQIEQTSDKNQTFNDAISILINISSDENYQWPVGQYLPVIKNILIKERQVNTLWLLSNILNQRCKNQQSYQTTKQLTKQLIKYDSISFCQQRILKKFDDQNGIKVFSCFVCTFMSNSMFLTFQQFKKVLTIIQNLSAFNLDYVDWFIIQALIQHSPLLINFNYQVLYSKLMVKFSQEYIKKKKTKMVLKVLQFFKSYIYNEIKLYRSPQILQQSPQQISKLKKNNYVRMSQTTIPLLTLCLQNRAPSIKSQLLQMCSLLLQEYFSYIDLQNEYIYRNLSQTLKNDAISILSKYSSKAIWWQLRYCCIFMSKLKQYKIFKQIIQQFINQNEILEGLSVLLKDKQDDKALLREITQFLLIILEQIPMKKIKDNKTQKELIVYDIMKSYQILLNNNLVDDQELYNRILLVLKYLEE